MRRLARAIMAVTVFAVSGHAQAQLTNTFTYQGVLNDAGGPANGAYDFVFRLFSVSGGGAALASVSVNDLVVVGGLVQAPLNFGVAFDNARRWIQVEVRPGASVGAFSVLGPRQELTITPHAGFAVRSGTVASHTLDDAYHDGAAILADAGPVLVNGAGGIESQGVVFSGNTLANGTVRARLSGSGNRGIEMTNFGTLGGTLQGYEENGTTRTFALEPDAGGAGGFLTINGGAGNTCTIDGATGAGNGPRMTLNGTPSNIIFDTNASGTATAVLPADAIDSGEILDEPGVANIAQNSVGVTLSTTTTLTNVDSLSITVPGPGFVVVMATMETLHNHANGTETNLLFGVSDASTNLPATADMGVRLAAALPTGTMLLTNNTHGVFSVAAAGTFTYFLNARMNTGNGQAFDTELTAMYFATAYGGVTARHGNGGGKKEGPAGPENSTKIPLPARAGLSPIDIERERQAELSRHMAAMAAQQQKMQVEIDRLRAELGNGPHQ